ncbi:MULTISPECIES: peptidoglycan-binding domain-containing protein [Streptomyces violaceusniger group]|uniref:Peptidoglycan binding-like domain-containing protein n=2 Tax=Streptomyces rhizosphaericus TaxID=114699 RepID=A0ABP4CTJ4_9ACTN|nr:MULTISPECIES: peptidoglycan-binding domain-containing protein [Streptomyces violaceusniger group]
MAAEPDPDRPAGRQVIEPTAVFPATPEYDDASEGPVEGWMEELDLFRPPGTELPPEAPPMADDDTQEMTGGPSAADAWTPQEAPPAPEQPPAPAAPAGRRRPSAALLVLAGLGAGVALSLVVMVDRDSASGAAGGGASATPTAPTAPATSGAPQTPSAPASQAPDDQLPPPGDPGDVLTLGSTGPEVTELQKRLLRIPNVYQNGEVNGEYDQTLAQAVSRFQVWYGIRGDANGVYGSATRRSLESRT